VSGCRQIDSEESLIQGFLAPLAAGHAGAFGLRDDAALLNVPHGQAFVATMDAIAAGVHFFADDDPADIGWKALAVNVSDLVAKGAAPHAYLMSLAFPEPPDRAWLAGFAAGLAEAQSTFGLSLAGGDTDRRPGPLSVTITALGLVPAGGMVQRGTARPGDRILVSGTLGDSALGLALRLDPSLQARWPLDAAQRAHLARRYLRPAPRLALVPLLRQYAQAAMDISDGLVKDLRRMAAASGVGARVYPGRLPLSAAAAAILAADPGQIGAIAAGGDDYEVLATAAPGQAAALIGEAAMAGVAVCDIGEMVVGDGVSLIAADGSTLDLGRAGYDHF
jgi:thiamine-monophosphate kinase